MNFVFENIKNYRNLDSGENKNNTGCDRVTSAPFYNFTRLLLHYNYKKFNKEIKYFSIKRRPSTYIILVGTHNDPHNWGGGITSEFQNYQSIFDNINDIYLDDLRNKRAYIIFDNSLEGFHEDWVFNFLHNECDRYNIHPNQVMYITGNLLVEGQYENWLKNNEQKERIIPISFSYFEPDVYNFSMDIENLKEAYESKELPTFDEHFDFKSKNVSDIKLFSFLNFKPRLHRVHMYKLLFTNNLLDKGLVSMEHFGSHGNDFGADRENKFCNHYITEDVNQQIKKTLPSRIYGRENTENDSGYLVRRFHPQINLESWIQIISETYFYDEYETLFLSEKTFKAIASSQPFIILGNKGSLKELKKLGYKTFDKWWDESYDELSDCDRMNAIIEVLKDIDKIEDKISWFKSMKEVIDYNKELLKKNSVELLPNAYKKVKFICESNSII